MTSRPRVIMQPPADPKQLHQIQEATEHMRRESQKLSRIKDVLEAEKELKRLEESKDKVRQETLTLVKRTQDEAERLYQETKVKADLLLEESRRMRDQHLAELKVETQALDQEAKLLQEEKNQLQQIRHGLVEEAERIERELAVVRGVRDDFKHQQVRLDESKQALQADIHAVGTRERKVKEAEEQAAGVLQAIEKGQKLLAEGQDLVKRAQAEARQERQAADERSHAAQERWNRTSIRETRCEEREREVAAREKAVTDQENRWGERLRVIDQREKACLLREAQRKALT